MAVSKYPSIVVLPQIPEPWPDILTFLSRRFPGINKDIWRERILDKKVLDSSGNAVTFSTPYIPGMKLQYFREVDKEPLIPFSEKIIYMDSNILVADKPHFLPVNPTGPYVNECLLHRLKKATGNPDLSPVNRIDKDTAGLVLFSCRKSTRGFYHELFSKREVSKIYEAVTTCPDNHEKSAWTIKNRMVKGDPWFRMKIEEGIPNTNTKVSLLKKNSCKALLRLTPITGKKHQLRLHLSSSGFSIINDRLYPDLRDEAPADFNSPLQLLSKELGFTDPLTGEPETFSSHQTLSESW